MTYNITLTRDEIRTIQKAIFAMGEATPTASPDLGHLERVYGKLLEATASDDVARRMQDEGDKYGHD